MTREERVLNIIKGKEVDYLPSQITIADRSKDEQVAKALGLKSGAELDDYLDNHLCLSFTLCDTPLFYRNVDEKMRELEAKGYAKVDRKNKIVYDTWGTGVQIGEDGFFACYNPLQGNAEKNKMAEPFLPDGFDREILKMPFNEAVLAYQPPNPMRPDNMDDIIRDLKANANGEHLVVPGGYAGIFERAYCVMGMEEFFVESLIDPESTAVLLDKITDYKIALAKRKIEIGCKVGHHSDDIGCQTGPLITPSVFFDLILPRTKKLFDVYKNAGLPVIMHSCGNIMQFLPALMDIGLDMLEPVQPCMGLEELMQRFGGKLTLWGGIDTQEILPNGTPAEVAAETRRVMHLLGKGGRYMVAPSQEVMSDVPAANIAAMLSTIREERGNYRSF
jgi:uroporphyrinogen decarboxylase